MSELVGADVEQVEALARRFEVSSKKLSNLLGRASFGIMITEWTGADIDKLRSEWNRQAKPSVARSVAALGHIGSELKMQAAQQREASAAGGARVSSQVELANATKNLNHILKDLSSLKGMTVDEASEWWNSLSTTEQDVLLANDKTAAVLGNLDGIPMKDRIKANQLNAQNYLDTHHDLSDDQRKYLDKVVDGGIKLVAFSPDDEHPENGGIVELIGEINANTTKVITYVPGTLTNMDSFYSGDVQAVANYLHGRDKEGVAVLVYKNGWFPPDFPAAGDPGNLVAGTTVLEKIRGQHNTGQTLASFQQAVDLEVPAGAKTAALAHSWGLSNVTASEQYGAHFDDVIGVSGSYIAPGWDPDPTTNYSQYEYKSDILQGALPLITKSTGTTDARDQPAFNNHVYVDAADVANSVRRPLVYATAGPVLGFFANGVADAYDFFTRGVDNHGRVAQNVPSNQKLLADVWDDLNS